MMVCTLSRHTIRARLTGWKVCWATLACTALLVACSDPGQATCPNDHGAIAQPIFNGAKGEQFLGLGGEELAGIVAIDNGPWPVGSLCSGVLLRPNWVISALHCLAIENPLVHIRLTPELVRNSQIGRVIIHPSLDVALLEIDPPASTGDMSGIRLLSTSTTDEVDWLGQRVEIAGYGLTESNAPNGLRFAVESVVEVTADKMRVDGLGRSGACEGDSGGPVLARGPDGRALVLGILSGGEASCLGRDSFVRMRALAEWLDSNLPPSDDEEGPVPCGQITAAGKCSFGTALRCVAGQLEADACDNGDVCGWDIDAADFRCVAAETDPCGGAGSLGVCAGSIAVTCAAGHRETTECATCGGCTYAPSNGAPQCSAATGG